MSLLKYMSLAAVAMIAFVIIAFFAGGGIAGVMFCAGGICIGVYDVLLRRSIKQAEELRLKLTAIAQYAAQGKNEAGEMRMIINEQHSELMRYKTVHDYFCHQMHVDELTDLPAPGITFQEDYIAWLINENGRINIAMDQLIMENRTAQAMIASMMEERQRQEELEGVAL